MENRSTISGTKRMMGQNRVVILTWLETIELISSVPNVLIEKTWRIGSTVLTAVNGTMRDASMFEFDFCFEIQNFLSHYVSTGNFYVG